MDVVAFLLFAFGVVVIREGYTVVGISMVLIALCGLAIFFVRLRSPWVFLPFSYPSWYLALPGGFLGEFMAGKQMVFSPGFPLGLALYYFGCICLWEREAHYVPWAAGFESRIAERADRPLVYWAMVALSFTLSASLLTIAIVGYVRGFGFMQS